MFLWHEQAEHVNVGMFSIHILIVSPFPEWQITIAAIRMASHVAFGVILQIRGAVGNFVTKSQVQHLKIFLKAVDFSLGCQTIFFFQNAEKAIADSLITTLQP